jgi:hypothetical protein
MKHITPEVTTFTVELTKDEVRAIQGAMQNPPPHLSTEDTKLAFGLFVGMSQILGLPMNDDGSIYVRKEAL